MRQPQSREHRSWLKLISLLLALLVWITFSGRINQQEALKERFVSAPLIPENQAPDTQLEIGNYQFQVTLEGPGDELDQLRSDEVAVRLNLESAFSGTNNYSITSDNVSLPSRFKKTRVKSVTPEVVVFTVTPTLEKEVKVVAMWSGNPAPNFKVEDVRVSPSMVTLQGPTEQVAALSQIIPESIDVTGATEDLRGTLKIDYEKHVGKDVVIKGNPSLSYRIFIREKEKSRSISRVYELNASELPDYVVGTKRLKLQITGPISVVDWFKPEWVSPKITLDDVSRALAELEEETSLEALPAPPDGEAAAETVKPSPPLMIDVKEEWLVSKEVSDAEPSWYEKVSQLTFNWIPERVEVRNQ
ncbi:MAG: YbbR-like domain-containing protein [Acidobacteriota bacterium]|nr:YbbR-like domain-containing protein [Acidobacteriota bacterium]